MIPLTLAAFFFALFLLTESSWPGLICVGLIGAGALQLMGVI